MTDADLALSLLRRICRDRFACVVAEGGSVLLDTSYISAPEDEVAMLKRLVDEAAASTPPMVSDTHYDGPVRIPIVPWAKDA